VESLGSSLPSSEPCYALFAWSHSFGQSSNREIGTFEPTSQLQNLTEFPVFIYSCPSSSPVKHRMLYSSGSTTTYQSAKTILSSSTPSIAIASRKVETSDPKELDEAYLRTELGYDNPPSDTPAVSSQPKGFAKPKGPPRRR